MRSLFSLSKSFLPLLFIFSIGYRINRDRINKINYTILKSIFSEKISGSARPTNSLLSFRVVFLSCKHVMLIYFFDSYISYINNINSILLHIIRVYLFFKIVRSMFLLTMTFFHCDTIWLFFLQTTVFKMIIVSFEAHYDI